MEKKRNKWIWLGFILLMSGYVTYMHIADGRAIDMDRQIDRHEKIMAGNSEFFNPWQYRIFAPLLLEGLILVYKKTLPAQPEVLPFIVLHFIQLILVFYLALLFYEALGLRNPFALWTGLIFVCYNMASSAFMSDLSYNTYFDIAFYLLAGLLIIRERYYWLVPLTFIATLNRETCAFIPLMVLIPFFRKDVIDRRKRLIVAGLSGIAFLAAFLGTRWYFGYQPAVGINGMTSPLDYLTFNVTFFRLYPLLIGTLGIIPLIVVLNFSKLRHLCLRRWFWLIVPAWFAIHLLKANAMETRLFLVPQVLIFVPAFLFLMERWYKAQPYHAGMHH